MFSLLSRWLASDANGSVDRNMAFHRRLNLEALEDRATPTTWYVSATAAPGGSGTSPSSPLQSLSKATQQALSNDIVQVAQGTYTFDFNIGFTQLQGAWLTGVAEVRNKNLSIIGGYTTNFQGSPSTDPSLTKIQGTSTIRGLVVYADPGAQASLNLANITVMNGTGNPANPAQYAAVGLSSDYVTNGYGGGMVVENATTWLTHVAFNNNTAVGAQSAGTGSRRGGAGVGGGLAVNNGAVTFAEVTFTGNNALGGTGQASSSSDMVSGGYAQGGGLFTFNTTVSGYSVAFANNTATGGTSYGTGFGAANGISDFADAQGGGAAFQAGSKVNLLNVTATGNSSVGGAAPNGGGGGAFGGGLYAEGTGTTDVTIYGGTLRGNSAVGGNGSNAVAPGNKGYGSFAQGGGFFASDAGAKLNGLNIVANTVRGGNGTVNAGSATGGGVGVQRTTSAINYATAINNCVIAGNSVVRGAGTDVGGGGGGGVAVQGLSLQMDNDTIDGNSASVNYIGQALVAIATSSSSLLTSVGVRNSIFSGHTTSSAIYVQGVQSTAPTAAVVNLGTNLFSQNNGPGGNYATGAGATLNTGVIKSAASPGYVSPGSPSYNYHLATGSAAIAQGNLADNANSGVLGDIDGDARGASPSLGCDEPARAKDKPVDTIGVVDPNASWKLKFANIGGAPDATFTYGAPGWVYFGGNWDNNAAHIDGDGTFDPATGTWYLRNHNSSMVTSFLYGAPGWVPVVGDWDGNGTDTIGVVNPSTMTWYLKNTNSAGPYDITFQYGGPNWIPVVGDWDGNGTTDFGAVNPTDMTWYLRYNTPTGAVNDVFQFGGSGYIPVVGDWNGDGIETVGVFNPATGTWYLRDLNVGGSGGGYLIGTPQVIQYGGSGTGTNQWDPVTGHWSTY